MVVCDVEVTIAEHDVSSDALCYVIAAPRAEGSFPGLCEEEVTVHILQHCFRLHFVFTSELVL